MARERDIHRTALIACAIVFAGATLLFATWIIMAIASGEIIVSNRWQASRTITLAARPSEFWLRIGMYVVGTIVSCVVAAQTTHEAFAKSPEKRGR